MKTDAPTRLDPPLAVYTEPRLRFSTIR